MRRIIPHNVLNIGAGMYGAGKGVKGSGASRFGPLLCNHFEFATDDEEDDDKTGITYCATSKASGENLWTKSRELTTMFGYKRNPVVRFLSDEEDGPDSHHEAIKTLKDPGFVVCSVPDPYHKDVITDALKAGKHVMTVKPLAPTLEDCLEILVCKEQHKDLMLQVEYHKRFDRAINHIRDIIESGRFGEIEHIDVYMDEAIAVPLNFFKDRLTSAADRPAEDLGPMRYIGNHFVDIIHYLTGSLPISITSTKATYGRVRVKGVNQPDKVEAEAIWGPSLYNAHLKGQFSSKHYAGWTKGEVGPVKTWPDQRIKVKFKDGTEITYDQSGSNFTLKIGDELQPVNTNFCFLHKNHGTKEYQCEGYLVDTYRTFLRNLTQMTEGTLPTEFPGYCDGEQALVANAFTEAVTMSWRMAREKDGVQAGDQIYISDVVSKALADCSDSETMKKYCNKFIN